MTKRIVCVVVDNVKIMVDTDTKNIIKEKMEEERALSDKRCGIA
jgi:hypothetical protein